MLFKCGRGGYKCVWPVAGCTLKACRSLVEVRSLVSVWHHLWQDVWVGPRMCTYVTHPDKMGTQSLGRARNKWRKYHLGVIWLMYCWVFFFPILRRLLSFFPTAQFDLRLTFKIHFKLQSLRWLKPCSLYPSSSICQKWPLNYRLTSRGQNFSSALHIVLKLTSN